MDYKIILCSSDLNWITKEDTDKLILFHLIYTYNIISKDIFSIWKIAGSRDIDILRHDIDLLKDCPLFNCAVFEKDLINIPEDLEEPATINVPYNPRRHIIFIQTYDNPHWIFVHIDLVKGTTMFDPLGCD